jgi:hypothetical protein
MPATTWLLACLPTASATDCWLSALRGALGPLSLFLRFTVMFELYDEDEYGVLYVAEAYDSIYEAKAMLETALDYAETTEQAFRIRGFLAQVYTELAS